MQIYIKNSRRFYSTHNCTLEKFYIRNSIQNNMSIYWTNMNLTLSKCKKKNACWETSTKVKADRLHREKFSMIIIKEAAGTQSPLWWTQLLYCNLACHGVKYNGCRSLPAKYVLWCALTHWFNLCTGTIHTTAADTVTLLGMIKRQSMFTPVNELKPQSDFK